MVHLILCFFYPMRSRFSRMKEETVPTHKHRTVLLYAEFWNKLLSLIAELTIAKDPLINEVDAFTDGHRKNVPMSPPNRLIVYPL